MTWNIEPHDGYMSEHNGIDEPPIQIVDSFGKVVACNTTYYPKQLSAEHADVIVSSVNGYASLAALVSVLLDNNPDETIADSGETVLDLWRHEVKQVLRLHQVTSVSVQSLVGAAEVAELREQLATARLRIDALEDEIRSAS